MKRKFRSYSGDTFLIKEENYDRETKEYREALRKGDEVKMLSFEEGDTGWEYIQD